MVTREEAIKRLEGIERDRRTKKDHSGRMGGNCEVKY